MKKRVQTRKRAQHPLYFYNFVSFFLILRKEESGEKVIERFTLLIVVAMIKYLCWWIMQQKSIYHSLEAANLIVCITVLSSYLGNGIFLACRWLSSCCGEESNPPWAFFHKNTNSTMRTHSRHKHLCHKAPCPNATALRLVIQFLRAFLGGSI